MNKSVFLLVLLVFLYSCSDKNSTSPTKFEIQPKSLHSYWIYENYDIDSNNIEKNANNYDSVVVSGQKTLLDKLGTIFLATSKNYNGQELGTSEYYSYEENQKLYMHSSRFNQFFSGEGLPGLPFTFKEQWVKVADINDDDWKAYEDEMPETSFMGLGTISGKLLITGEIKGKKDFLLNNKKYQAYEFYLNVSFNGNLKFQQAPIPVNLNFDQKIYIQFVNGIGLVQQINKPTKVQLLGFTAPGSKSVLTKYLIK